jgi:pilus assembly protein Flp/PilA
MKEKINWITNEEDGQGMVEYALLLALVVIVAIGALSILGETINKQLYEKSVGKMTF